MAILVVGILGAIARAQSSSRLIDEEPFDRIVLNQANGSQELVVLPLDFPNRKVPAELPAVIRARLVKNPEEELEISRNGIERIELFEDLVLRETETMISAKRFDDAFDNLAFLRDRNANKDQLDEITNKMLYEEATTLYQAKQFERAWLLLDEIYQRSPDRRGLVAAMRRVLDLLFRQQLERSNFADARRRYEFVEARYAQSLPDLLTDWKQRLTDLATQAKTKAQAHFDRGEYRDAYLTSVTMMNAWPELPGARALAARIAQRYPLLRVGVAELAGDSDRKKRASPPFDLADWTSRRTRRLLQRQFAEEVAVGSDGAVFQSPLGKFQIADDLRSMTLDLQVPSGTGVDASGVALQWLSLTRRDHPFWRESWAALLERVEVQDGQKVVGTFRRVHLRPEALLTIPLDRQDARGLWRPYVSTGVTESQQTFQLQSAYALATDQQPREIIERAFESPGLAVAALKRGELDLVDRLFPAEVPVLQRDTNVQVVPYRVASIHLLIANPQRDYPANRLFRKAIVYAIDRQRILARDLLGGADLPGCRVVSGPFSTGIREDDPLDYGYDARIVPRPYDPRHARTLWQLAQVEVEAAAKKRKVDVPVLGELVLVHPPHEMARVACQEIVNDLKVIGIACRLRSLASHEMLDGDWDFRYLDLVMSDPLTDAPQLLASDGLAACSSPHVNLALRQLAQVDNWNDAGERLRVIHQLVYDDTSVLPLWQIVDHLGHRKELSGLPPELMSTYQGIESWRVTGAP